VTNAASQQWLSFESDWWKSMIQRQGSRFTGGHNDASKQMITSILFMFECTISGERQRGLRLRLIIPIRNSLNHQQLQKQMRTRNYACVECINWYSVRSHLLTVTLGKALQEEKERRGEKERKWIIKPSWKMQTEAEEKARAFHNYDVYFSECFLFVPHSFGGWFRRLRRGWVTPAWTGRGVVVGGILETCFSFVIRQ